MEGEFKRYYIFNRVKKYLKIICLMIVMGTSVFSAKAQTYNSTSAVNYANQWAADGDKAHHCEHDGNSGKYNNSSKSAYQGTSNWNKKCQKTGYGNDCANFIWQCITGDDAGGLNYGLIIECKALHKKLISHLGEVNSNYAECTSISGTGPSFVPSWLAPGDVVIYWNNGVNTTKTSGSNHAAIVVAGSGSNALLNAHTSNRYRRSFDDFGTGSSWNAISYYHLSGVNSGGGSTERPILNIHVEHNPSSDEFYNYNHLIHSGHHNNEECIIRVDNAVNIGIANIKIRYKGIIGEPAYSNNDPQAYYNGNPLLSYAEHDNYNFGGNQWFFYPATPAAWDGKWIKIIAINTNGIDNDNNDVTHWNSQWVSSEPFYIKVFPSSVTINDIKPKITSINGQNISDKYDVKQISLKNKIPFVIDGKGYVGNNSVGDYEEYIAFHYAILANPPLYTNGDEPATINQSTNKPNKYIGGEDNHDGSVANKYYLLPSTPNEWNNHYVKIIPYNALLEIWGEPRYIQIGQPTQTLQNDNRNGAPNTSISQNLPPTTDSPQTKQFSWGDAPCDIEHLTPEDYKNAFKDTAFDCKFAFWCGWVANQSYSDGNSAMAEMGFKNIRSGITWEVKYDIGEKEINGQNYIMISIRGSSNPLNWATNFDFGLKNWFIGYPLLTPAAHGGFYDRCIGVWKNSYDSYTLNDLVYDNPNARYIVTGHSMGGAVAELLALKLSEKLSSPNQIICYGFASPPVGDPGLIIYAAGTKKISDRIYKLENLLDLVPHAGLLTNNLAGHIKFFSKTGAQLNHSMYDVYLRYLKEQIASSCE